MKKLELKVARYNDSYRTDKDNFDFTKHIQMVPSFHEQDSDKYIYISKILQKVEHGQKNIELYYFKVFYLGKLEIFTLKFPLRCPPLTTQLRN